MREGLRSLSAFLLTPSAMKEIATTLDAPELPTSLSRALLW